MKNKFFLSIILILFCVSITKALPTRRDGWNFVGVMYPGIDSMRIRATGFGLGSSGYIGLGGVPNSSNFYNNFYKITYSDLFDVYVWAPIADFPFGTSGALGFAIGGKGYVFTAHRTGFTLNNNLLYAYDTLANSWSQMAPFPGAPREWATCFVVSDKAYICTGSNASGLLSEVWQYDAALNTWTQKNNFSGGARYDAASFTIGNKGYISTGALGMSNYKKDLWEYEPTTDSWTQKASIPGGERYGAPGFGIDNRGYIGAGYGTNSFDTWEYNPALDKWVQKEPFPPRCMQGAYWSVRGRGYAGTGICNRSDVWAFVPDKLSIGTLNSFEYCMGDSIMIPYTTNGFVPQPGNEFIAEMDSSLSFNVFIGKITSTAMEGVIHGYIPLNVVPGVSNHKIRIRATNPAYIGGTNALNLSMNLRPAQPTITRNGNVLTSGATAGNQWYNGSGAILGATNQTYITPGPGNYYVKVTSNGCSSNASNTITVTQTAVKELRTAAIKVYPNPASSLLNIELPVYLAGTTQLRIFNAAGQLVYGQSLNAAPGTLIRLPVSTFARGLYVLQLTDAYSNSHQSFLIQ